MKAKLPTDMKANDQPTAMKVCWSPNDRLEGKMAVGLPMKAK